MADPDAGHAELPELWQHGEDLTAGNVGVEVRHERTAGGQRQIPVLASTLEVGRECTAQGADGVELIEIDAAPDVAPARADVANLERHVPHDLAADPGAELVDVRLLDVLVHARG